MPSQNATRTPELAGRDAPLRAADFSDDLAGESCRLAPGQIPCRTLAADDLPALIRIGNHNTGRDVSAYYQRRVAELLNESGVRVSLVAELEGRVVGFIMARVDFGEFGRTEPAAVMDTIGVDPVCAQRGVGTALVEQLLDKLAVLKVKQVHTEVGWDQFDLLAFLQQRGFHPGQRLCFSRAVPR